MNGISQLLDNDSEITHIDKEAKLVKGKLLLGGQDIVAKLDQRVVVAPHHLLHLIQSEKKNNEQKYWPQAKN